MKKLNVVLAVLFLQVNSGVASECRDAVVEAYTTLGSSIERDSFSSAEFSDLELSVEEFNALDSNAQEEIYIQIRPMRVTVESTIISLNQQINRYAGTFYEMYVLDKLELWREAVDPLRSCEVAPL